MISHEFILLAGVVIAGLVFFMAIQSYITGEIGKTGEFKVIASAERISSILEKFSAESSYARYCINISLSDVKIESGYLTLTQKEGSYTLPVPEDVKDADLKEVAHLCFVRNIDGSIEIFGEPIICDMDGICDERECRYCCPDCSPSDCAGDGECELCLGENCLNSPDCSCREGVCCPADPASDDYGCVNESRINLSEGEECFCDNECRAGLKCNPTSPEFTEFEKACCEPGKMWNGSACTISNCTYPCVPNCILPKKWDWRNVEGINWLPPIRNQGACGSCWAFSAVGTIEGTYNIEHNLPGANTDLSEQQLVSNDGMCCGYCGDCGGGLPHLALNYVKSTGIVDEDCFRYAARTISCNLCSDYSQRLVEIENYGPVPSDLDEIKRAIICRGPLSVGSFTWRHAIVLVGYDDNSSVCRAKYNYPGCWIIRNSWGPITGWVWGVWHDKGYAYIPYSGHPFSDIKNYVYYVKGTS